MVQAKDARALRLVISFGSCVYNYFVLVLVGSSFNIFYLLSDSFDEDNYLSLVTDWDLDAAISSSSNPALRLKVEVKPFDDEGQSQCI